MCLGIPGKIVAWTVQDPLFGKAMVEFAGIRRECFMACVPEAEVGSYVIVHAGIAICGINESEALRTLRDLATVEEISSEDEWPSSEASSL